ncbi:biopolymer transporter ExbD [Marinicauda salina]|jgi:biopolymer transport protein ExbD|uniref:Biopolymer transporter ExbD n=1 Tax=Marinicauda salina TaxID=2135793 RepID=A0A2U2BSM8_9PROT|nr:biopolymer transporter ExbD [Marinicauda salina]PWE16986.1 biopolymer transporter ExbD [Marinicauda salina]
MRRSRRKGDDQADVNMTPMLDIVFILLIFFIVTATFLQEQGIDMQPPPPSEDQPEESNPVILVQINDRNQVYVNQDPTSSLRVLAAVSRVRAEQPNSAVLIQPTDEAHHGIVVQIWDDMRANNIPVSIQRANEAES